MRWYLHTLLVLALVTPSVTAAAPEELVLEVDMTDALGDARAYPDVRMTATDIARFTSRLEDDQVVQTVHVVGPLPEDDHWIEVRNDFGGAASYTMKVEWMDGEDVPTSHFSAIEPGQLGKRVEFSFERGTDMMMFRWPASAIPESAKCVNSKVTTLSFTEVEEQRTQVDDELVVTPAACGTPARFEGVSGVCPPAEREVIQEGMLEDARDDVGEREGIGMKPYDDPSLDILSLETRVEEGWVIQTVTLVEPSHRDQIVVDIENQFTGNASMFEQGDRVHLNVFETAASGSILEGFETTSIHARAQRVEPAGWEVRWCAAALPADAVCFAPHVRVSMDNQRYVDRLGLPRDPCPAPGDESGGDEPDAAPTPTTPPTATETDDTTDELEDDTSTPGLGALGLLAAAGVGALAFRRRD